LKNQLPVYMNGDSVTGTLEITPPPGKVVTHGSILLLLIGEYRKPDGDVINRFFIQKQELVPAGELRSPINTKYTFEHVNFPVSSFQGNAVHVVYTVQVVVVHKIIDFKVESPFTVLIFTPKPTEIEPIHNEVGIRNILHIEFVFPRSTVGFDEPLVGAVYFILVKLRIVHMSLSLYQVENYSSDDAFIKKKTEIKTIEIMDGAPVRGDHVPIRFFVSEGEIWPFTASQKGYLKVDHYVRATLTDENGKKYFKRLKVEFARFKPE